MEIHQKTIAVADIRISVKSSMLFQFSEACAPFEVAEDEADVVLTICPSTSEAEQILTEENRIANVENGAVFQHGQMMAIARYTGFKENEIGWYSVWKNGDVRNYCLNLLKNENECYKINPLAYIDLSGVFAQFRSLILHSSLIDFKGHGIAFTAPSGTGKSTQANLWSQYKQAEIINGDRAVIRKLESGYHAYGSPYAGSSHIYQNKAVPLRAIVVLRQAKYNKIRRMKAKESYLCLLSEMSISSWNRKTVELQSIQIQDLLNHVPVYLLECCPDEGAVHELSRELVEIL